MEDAYQNFLIRHNKTCSPFEYARRFQAFVKSARAIEEHNSNPDRTWDMGFNKFSDWLPYESGLELDSTAPGGEVYEYDPNEHIPAAVDWRDHGWVTPVKNQLGCGSCYSFSVVGTLEAQHANVTNELVSLSAQQFVDCIPPHHGCVGGDVNTTMDFATGPLGVLTEADYPYTGYDCLGCRFNWSARRILFTRYFNIKFGDCRGLLHAVAKVGPVSVSINSNFFKSYKSGIFNISNDVCRTDELTDAVLVIGYGQTRNGTKYWILKQSWGTDWGDKGYAYWNRDTDNMCGICQRGAFVLAH